MGGWVVGRDGYLKYSVHLGKHTQPALQPTNQTQGVTRPLRNTRLRRYDTRPLRLPPSLYEF